MRSNVLFIGITILALWVILLLHNAYQKDRAYHTCKDMAYAAQDNRLANGTTVEDALEVGNQTSDSLKVCAQKYR